ncbi:MAG: metallophosphoesterase [Candidatus Daviesbacteria bacterium]|nr:MAG: metallophosphoesterase [Candidatus Daviesbacteria bacterium]
MFRRRQKRSINLPFVIFRLGLSLTMFALLLGGGYYAFRYFSGVDPLKIAPQTAFLSALASNKDLSQTIDKLINQLNLPKISLSQHNQIQGTSSSLPPDKSVNQSGVKSTKPVTILFKFALVADSHNENDYLGRALQQAKLSGANFVIGLGDYTDTGTTQELKKTKDSFDAVGLRYYLTAGDHDLWDSRNRQVQATTNFSNLFGPPFQSFTVQGVKFIMVYNSDNYEGLSTDQFDWLKTTFEQIKSQGSQSDFPDKLILVLTHEPFYHPVSDHMMGRVNPKLVSQAKELIKMFKDNGVAEVFTGDLHFYSQYSDPDSKLKMTTVGAVTALRNLQNPRFSLVTVYSDYSYLVEDVEIK